MEILPLTSLSPQYFETPAILKKVAMAARSLAELKGVVASIPQQHILINTLGMQEAKDSSAIENIVTTHDELYKRDVFPASPANLAEKEVLRYRQALWVGFETVKSSGLLTTNHILKIQSTLENNQAGFRKLPGTALKDGAGRTVYTPPQDPAEIIALMNDLERFMNDDTLFETDPLVKMALIHYQFESIHPFYDGNGRTGRIINVLYLVQQGLLDIPVLYLSRHIVQTKPDYYRLLQAVREHEAWEEWVLYMLTAVERTATAAIATIHAIQKALLDAKHGIRTNLKKIYSQDLINSLFSHPYTKVQFLERDLKVTRLTAAKYLDALAGAGFLVKQKIGQSNYYINTTLTSILTDDSIR